MLPRRNTNSIIRSLAGWSMTQRKSGPLRFPVATEAMSKIGVDAEDIHAIGITNQRETTIVWDKKTGEPVYPAIVWQCRRTADMIEKMEKDGMSELVRKKTGLIPDAYFSGTKLKWILDHVEGARERAQNGELLFGTVDTWLIWKLTKGKVHVTDYTNASRTMLFDIHQRKWDKEILEYLNIPECMLPEVKPSSCIYGYTNENLSAAEFPSQAQQETSRQHFSASAVSNPVM